MIISHKYKFIFFKTSKTAGTSFEIAMSKFCGPEDIITPIIEEDEEIRESLGYRTPQNYLKEGSLSEKRYYNHISASEVKELISKDTWNSYFKFCFERNPMERFISFYFWLFKEEPRPLLSEFLESQAINALKSFGRNIYTINNNIILDKIYKYERMEESLKDIRKRLSLPEDIILPRAKGKFRKDKRAYYEILKPDDIYKIYQLFKLEMENFNYKLILSKDGNTEAIYTELLENKQKIISEKIEEIQDIYNSKAYKLGKALASPFLLFRK